MIRHDSSSLGNVFDIVERFTHAHKDNIVQRRQPVLSNDLPR
jgi:hypothetical protein